MKSIFDKPRIAIDFDGTLFETDYPEIIRPMPNAIKSLFRLKEAGFVLILNTCREGRYLQDAINAIESYGIEFDGYNENPEGFEKLGFADSRKIGASVYIDDRSVLNPIKIMGWNALTDSLIGKYKNDLVEEEYTNERQEELIDIKENKLVFVSESGLDFKLFIEGKRVEGIMSGDITFDVLDIVTHTIEYSTPMTK